MADSKRLQQLDLNLLKVFQTLYVEQNMTRTAEVLHLTPSAVSHAVKRLRDTLDDPLFRRSHNKMLPTPVCQRMAPLVIDNLMRLQQILQQWGEFEANTSSHHFKIGIHDALEPAIVPQLSKLLADSAPSVSFSSIKIDRSNLTRQLSSGYIDFGIDIALPIYAPVEHTQLLESKFGVLMRRGHPLERQLDQQRYLSANHLTVSSRSSGMSAADILLHERGFVRNTTIRCQNYFAARDRSWLVFRRCAC